MGFPKCNCNRVSSQFLYHKMIFVCHNWKVGKYREDESVPIANIDVPLKAIKLARLSLEIFKRFSPDDYQYPVPDDSPPLYLRYIESLEKLEEKLDDEEVKACYPFYHKIYKEAKNILSDLSREPEFVEFLQLRFEAEVARIESGDGQKCFELYRQNVNQDSDAKFQLLREEFNQRFEIVKSTFREKLSSEVPYYKLIHK